MSGTRGPADASGFPVRAGTGSPTPSAAAPAAHFPGFHEGEPPC
ncbi:hypothetical protein DA2_1704 [Desulfovibrio sp. A2]|nr:hypothetical protein DA2_1704 [Desulfovibrio sp. A2]